METLTAKTAEDLKGLTPIAKRWLAEADFDRFGLDSRLAKGLEDLNELIAGVHSDLFMLMKDEQHIGFAGIRSFMSPVGENLIAEEHYLYVLPEYRGRGGLILLRAAREWAKENMCTHLIMNASTLASKLHDKVCKLYEYMDMKKFETSYICEV
jgi:GNAT superfamily N-acetyltransferase